MRCSNVALQVLVRSSTGHCASVTITNHEWARLSFASTYTRPYYTPAVALDSPAYSERSREVLYPVGMLSPAPIPITCALHRRFKHQEKKKRRRRQAGRHPSSLHDHFAPTVAGET